MSARRAAPPATATPGPVGADTSLAMATHGGLDADDDTLAAGCITVFDFEVRE